ncbi:TetR/AcrR family transcriptional regulator [Curtobacterium flaccumfaciens pv. poinsettiae]|nr:TetR/AcrR family transcriptional regulator [Curtobacterium flaccumfaciens pv. poinsettiae]
MPDEQPMPAEKPMRADARRNRDAIIAAARTAFERDEQLRFDDFAGRAGVGVGTLYRHFPTRAALAAAVYRGEVDVLCRRARDSTLPPGREPRRLPARVRGVRGRPRGARAHPRSRGRRHHPGGRRGRARADARRAAGARGRRRCHPVRRHLRHGAHAAARHRGRDRSPRVGDGSPCCRRPGLPRAPGPLTGDRWGRPARDPSA